MRIATLFTLTLLNACASAPPRAPTPEPPAAPDPDASLPPAVRALPSPPWVFAFSEAVVAPLPPGLVDGTPSRAEDEYAYVTLDKRIVADRLPAHLRALVGQTLTLLDDAGAPACQARLKGFSARVFLEAEAPGTWELINPETYDDDGNPITDPPPRPEPERLEAAFQAAPQRLVALFENPDGTPFAACSRVKPAGQGEAPEADDVQPYLAIATQSAAPNPVLTRADAPADIFARAIDGFRAHGLWELQQQAYVHSIEAERTRARKAHEAEIAEAKARKAKKKELAEITLDDRTTGVPKTWDEVQTDDWNQPRASAFTDSKGTVRAVVLEVGNDASCAAPRAWMAFLVDGKRELAPWTYGVGAAPTAVLDLGGDNLALGFSAFYERRIERVDPVADRPVVLRFGTTDGQPRLDCSWDQIPPLRGAE